MLKAMPQIFSVIFDIYEIRRYSLKKKLENIKNLFPNRHSKVSSTQIVRNSTKKKKKM